MSDMVLDENTGFMIPRKEWEETHGVGASTVVISTVTNAKAKSRGKRSPRKIRSTSTALVLICCRICHQQMQGDKLVKHFEKLHITSDAVYLETYLYAILRDPEIKRYFCPLCGALALKQQLLQHLQDFHIIGQEVSVRPIQTAKLPQGEMVKCKYCDSFVRKRNMEKHCKKMHKMRLKKVTDEEQAISENEPSRESVIQSDRETLFGDKHLGPWAHEWDGKFGSISLYDDYGDEASAD